MSRLIDADEYREKLVALEEEYNAKFLEDSQNSVHEASMCGRLFGFTTAKHILDDMPTVVPKATTSKTLKEIDKFNRGF